MKIIKTVFFLIALFICFNVSASSQTETKKKDAADSVKTEAIKVLLKLSGTTDFAYVVIDDVMSNHRKMITGVPEEYWEKLKKQVDVAPFTARILGVYDKRFTLEEIKQLTAFFQSPVGAKWVVSLRDMNDEVMIQADLYGKYVYESLNKQLEKDGHITIGK